MKQAIKNLARMLHQADPQACFAFEFWDGDTICFGRVPQVTLRLKTKSCARSIITKGFWGFGESYTKGELEVEDCMAELFRLGFAIGFDEYRLSLWQRFRFFILMLLNRDTLRHAQKNISYHYDRGDEFYGLYLDKTMTYSCAYFKGPEDSLEQAQLNKYDHIARKLLLKPDETLLDIGCGWGGMLIFAAQKYGIRGIGNTLSKCQFEYANQKITELGLQDRIQVFYRDYRHLSGKFDKIVSIGMFEHVGKRYMPTLTQKVAELLKTDGLGLLHTIGKSTPTSSDPWTFKYIFPGAYIPALPEITSVMGKSGFCILDVENLRLHYARTLEKWIENYENNIAKVKEQSDESFVRQWRLFLNSQVAAFKYGDSQLFQILFCQGTNNALPMTRAHVYID